MRGAVSSGRPYRGLSAPLMLSKKRMPQSSARSTICTETLRCPPSPPQTGHRPVPRQRGHRGSSEF